MRAVGRADLNIGGFGQSLSDAVEVAIPRPEDEAEDIDTG
jgi:hypothetical protein